MGIQLVTIKPEAINTTILKHAPAGIIGRAPLLGPHRALWQLRIVNAHAHWTGRANEPIRISATAHYRSALAQNTREEDEAYADLERQAWHAHGTTRAIIATIIPKIEGHGITLLGGYTHNRTELFFTDNIPCATWKHVAAAINRALARTNIINARGIKSLPVSTYPTLFFPSTQAFLNSALHHPLTYEVRT